MIKKLSKVVFGVLVIGLFSVTSLYAQDVTLNWDPVTDPILGYRIYYGTEQAGPPYNGTGATEGNSPITMPLAQDANTDPAIVEFDLHNLPDQKTWFVVTSYNATEESGYSNEVSTSLSIPDNLTIVTDNVSITINVD